jgi:hypothetical protein
MPATEQTISKSAQARTPVAESARDHYRIASPKLPERHPSSNSASRPNRTLPTPNREVWPNKIREVDDGQYLTEGDGGLVPDHRGY